MDTIRIALGCTPTSTASKATWIMPTIGIDRRDANQRRMNCRRNGTKSSRRSWDTDARSFDLLEFPRRSHLLGERKAVFGVDHLASAGNFPQPVFGGVIANRDIAAGFKAVSDDFCVRAENRQSRLGHGLGYWAR